MANNIFTIANRPYQTDNFPLNKNHLPTTHNSLFELNYLGLIKVTGERASEFLQGQLTCDVREITPHTMRQGAQCNLKGRVLALMDIIACWDHYWLVLPKDLIPQTLSSLEKTAQLSRVTLEAVENIQVWGLHQAISSPSLPAMANDIISNKNDCCYRLDDTYCIILNRSDDLSSRIEAFNIHNKPYSEIFWHYLQLLKQRITIYPETRGEFLPHRLNLQDTGAISFKKGCYKGQEIIARMQYLGKLKHELNITTIQLNAPPELGKPLLNLAAGETLREVVDYCPIDLNGEYLIAIIVERS